MAWLDDDDLTVKWADVVDEDGKLLGYLPLKDCYQHGLNVQLVETPERFLKDPYVRNHARLSYARGLFTNGQDLNDIQLVLLQSELIKKNEMEDKIRLAEFEQSMMVNNQPLFQWYKEQKDKIEGVESKVEERIPENIEEFLSALAAFNDEEEGSEENKEGEGWLSSILSDQELEEMGDE